MYLGRHIVAVSLLQQRKIEAVVLKTFLDVATEKLGKDQAEDLFNTTIEALAVDAGRQLHEKFPAGDLSAFSRITEDRDPEESNTIELIEKTDKRLHFLVTRCRFAEAYAEMGLADKGYQLSCQRDPIFLNSYSDKLQLERPTTIMEGHKCCEFIFTEKAD